MTDTTSAMPLYHQVAGVLRQQILDSRFPAGSQLPPEDVLSDQFSVSRSTIRQAISILVTDGLVVRRQGRGTFVCELPKQDTSRRLQGSFGGAIEESYRTESRNLEIEFDQPFPDFVVAALQMRGTRGTLIRRTRTVADEPICHSIAFLSEVIEYVPTVAKLRKHPLAELLLKEGFAVDEVIQTIRAAPAGPLVSTQLNVDIGSPVLEAEAIVFDAAGRPVELVRVWYRSDRYEYMARLKLLSNDPGSSSIRPRQQFPRFTTVHGSDGPSR